MVLSKTANGLISKHEAADNYVPVADFYNGRSVFITGGTGFMGKVRV